MDVRKQFYCFIFIFLSVLLVGCGGGNPIKLANLADIQVSQDSSLEIDLNPLEPDEAPYTYTIKTPPKYGTLSMGPDHRHWIYTPMRNYFGPDNFEFEATDGTNKKSAKATIAVNEIFIAGRPMTVKFLELTSPAPGELHAIWFNSYDIDGDVAAIRYHVYLSTDEGFYPSDDTLVETLQGAVKTTLHGLIEDQTYYIAILAEDVDGKLSKRIDKREVKLVASNLVFRNDVEVVSVANLPVTSVALGEAQVELTLSSSVQNLTGKILQLDEANDFAFVRIGNPVSISPTAHQYHYSFAQAQEFIQDMAFTLNQGTYDPAGALIEYYQNTAGSLDSLMANRSGMVSMASAGPGYLADLLEVLLSEWARFQNVDELYEFLIQSTTISIDGYKSEEESCGELSPTFEPLDPVGWRPDPLEFNVTFNFKCSIAYTISVKWHDLLRNAPELLSAEINGSVATSFDASGKLTQSFNLLTVDIPRDKQFVKTKAIRLWMLPIPYTIAFNVKGTLSGEAFGEITGSFGADVLVGVRAGARYTSDAGFGSLPNSGLFLQNTIPTNPKELLSQVNFSAKAGVDLKARVGPELILSIANVATFYKKGFDGVASLNAHVGPALAYSIETEENPSIVVEKLGAPPFGIGAYEWTGSWGGDYELALHYPVAEKREFSFDPIAIKFLHLPAFDITYKDKQVGSNEFEVAAVNSDLFQLNDADLLMQETRWHVVDPSDATLVPYGVDNMRADGRWANDYDGDAVIVFEYTPDTLASMVAGLSETTKPLAKQYKILVPGFLLEGGWSYELVKFEADILESFKNFIPYLWKPSCEILMSPTAWGTTTFSYDTVNQSYWIREMVENTRAPVFIRETFECEQKQSQIILDEPRIFTNRVVEKVMSSDELNRSFVGSSPFVKEYFDIVGPVLTFLIASGKVEIVNSIELLGPDQFYISYSARFDGATFIKSRIQFSRLDRN